MFKKVLLSTVLFVSISLANAAIITVSNFGGSPAMYTSLTAAVNAAAPDDTLLIHGSATPYTFDNVLGFNKRLVVIGSGWNNVGTKIRGAIECCGVWGVPFSGGAEGSIFRGIEFITMAHVGVSQIIFESCRFNPESNAAILTNYMPFCGNCGSGDIGVQDVVFQNCYINQVVAGLYNDSNVLFQNCIFRNNSSTGNVGFTGLETLSATNPHVFDHNIFLSDFAIDLTNAVFTNNIFSNVATAGIDGGNFCYDCQFENNMTYCSSCALSSITGIELINNLENQAEPFLNNVTDMTLADFNLNASSTGNNYATDGSDVGVHGGSSPYEADTYYGSILLEMPVITAFSLLNNIVQQGNNLNFQATSIIPAE
jgi:hypothetical protein